MSLWVDKYRPTSLSKLDYHKELAAHLKKLVSCLKLSSICCRFDRHRLVIYQNTLNICRGLKVLRHVLEACLFPVVIEWVLEIFTNKSSPNWIKLSLYETSTSHRDSRTSVTTGPVVRRLDNGHPADKSLSSDSAVCFVNTYPLDSDLSSG